MKRTDYNAHHSSVTASVLEIKAPQRTGSQEFRDLILYLNNK